MRYIAAGVGVKGSAYILQVIKVVLYEIKGVEEKVRRWDYRLCVV